MPIPDLSSINKQVSDSLKTWLPRLADPEYLANTKVGQAATGAGVLSSPGIGLAAYGISKLRDTKFGRGALNAVDDIANAVNFPIGPEVKAGSAIAKHGDESLKMLGAVPAGLIDYLFKEVKPGVYNYHKIEQQFDKFAQGLINQSSSNVARSTLAETGFNKVLEVINDPKTTLPKHLENDYPAALEYITKEHGLPAMNKLNYREGNMQGEVTKLNSKDVAKSNLDYAKAETRNPEEAIINSQTPVDKEQQKRVEVAGGIFDKVLSPRMRAILNGKMNRESASEISSSMPADDKLNRKAVSYYVSRGGLENSIAPIREAEGKDPNTLGISELQDLVKAKRKMLGPTSPDTAIEMLRRHGSTSQDELTLMRRFLLGTPPSKLTPGKSDDILVKANLISVNDQLEKLFKVSPKK